MAEETDSADEEESRAEKTQEASTETTDEAGANLATGGGSPWIDSDLKNNITEDMEISIKDDFHLAVNYDWLLNNEIPDGYRSAGSFLDVEIEIEDKAQALLEDQSITGHDAELIQSLYQAYLDWDTRNQMGVEPIVPVIEDIKGIDSISEVSDFICDPMGRAMFVPTFIGAANDSNLNDSDSYIVWVYHDNFTLSDAAEYQNRTEYGERYYSAYKKQAVTMLERVGYTADAADSMFEKLIAFEGRLAEVSYTSEDSMQPDYTQKLNNVMTISELEALMPDFPIRTYIESLGYANAKEFLVMEPAYLERLNELYTEEYLEDIKNYMLVKYVINMTENLDRESFTLNIDTKNEINGSNGQLSDELYAYQVVTEKLTEPMERAYIEKYDAAEMKKDITDICEEVISYYRTMLQETEWMSDETREKAVEKLDTIRINAVYPDKWKNYSTLSLNGLSYLDCLKAISEFENELDISHMNGKIDKDLWTCNTLETNAYYNQSNNSINIMLGILGGNYYEDGMSDEEMYAGIGAIIGHEISHAFDTNGAQYDSAGNLTDWWTEEDYTAFQTRAEKLIQYYDGITAFEGGKVVGANIQTEAIADMAGLKSILAIAKSKENFYYELFFRHYAKTWRSLSTREFEYMHLTQNLHPLDYLRTNVTVQQFDEFYDTFDIQPDDGMYLAPENRIAVW